MNLKSQSLGFLCFLRHTARALTYFFRLKRKKIVANMEAIAIARDSAHGIGFWKAPMTKMPDIRSFFYA